MQYRKYTYAQGTWDTYFFEKNLQGDIVAVYSKTGTKLVTYTYDAWGNATVSYTNSGASTGAAKNPFRYRGYYFDSELNLYYLNSRYYDQNLSRFLSLDSIMSKVNGSLYGFNLFAYCFNNPLKYTDNTGDWAEWNAFLTGVGEFVLNIAEAFIESLEVQAGIGFGLGLNLSDTATAEISRDTYVGFDDGAWITGNLITAEMSLFDSVVKIGDTYNHLVEKGGDRVTSSGSANDGPFDMINYPDVEQGNQWSLGIFSMNNEGDLLIGVSGSFHFVGGGHASASFNVKEFFERLFD